MKLRTSQILAQLSEQDRNKVETKLAELNSQKLRLVEQKNQSQARMQQLNQQREQAMRNRNAASLLQAFNMSLLEQQSLQTSINTALADLEQQKQVLLNQFTEIYRTQHAYETIHDKQQHQQRRSDEQKSQRLMDDMIASRHAVAAA